MAVAAVQPQTADTVSQEEHLEVADRIGDWLHRNDEPLTTGLVLVLQAQLRTDLIRTECQTKLDSSVVDLLASGAVLEAEFSNRDVDEVELHLYFAHRERRLAQDVVRPVADSEPRLLDGSAEVVSGSETDAELHSLPDRKLSDLRLDERLPVPHELREFTIEVLTIVRHHLVHDVDQQSEPLLRDSDESSRERAEHVFGHGLILHKRELARGLTQDVLRHSFKFTSVKHLMLDNSYSQSYGDSLVNVKNLTCISYTQIG